MLSIKNVFMNNSREPYEIIFNELGKKKIKHIDLFRLCVNKNRRFINLLILNKLENFDKKKMEKLVIKGYVEACNGNQNQNFSIRQFISLFKVESNQSVYAVDTNLIDLIDFIIASVVENIDSSDTTVTSFHSDFNVDNELTVYKAFKFEMNIKEVDKKNINRVYRSNSFYVHPFGVKYEFNDLGLKDIFIKTNNTDLYVLIQIMRASSITLRAPTSIRTIAIRNTKTGEVYRMNVSYSTIKTFFLAMLALDYKNVFIYKKK